MYWFWDNFTSIYESGPTPKVACLLSWITKFCLKKGSLEYAIARDQLIKHHVFLDDGIVESNNDYWGQFKAWKN